MSHKDAGKRSSRSLALLRGACIVRTRIMHMSGLNQPSRPIARVRLLEIERTALECLDSAAQLQPLTQMLMALGRDLPPGENFKPRADLFAETLSSAQGAYGRECGVRSMTQWIKGLHCQVQFAAMQAPCDVYPEFLLRILDADKNLAMGGEIPLRDLALRLGFERTDNAAALAYDEDLAYTSANWDTPYGLMIHRERVVERLNELEVEIQTDRMANRLRDKLFKQTTVNFNGPVSIGNRVHSTVSGATIEGSIAVSGTDARVTERPHDFQQRLREDVQEALAALVNSRAELARVHAELPPALFRILHDLEAIGVKQSQIKETVDELWARHMVPELRSGRVPRSLNIINTLGSLATLQGLASKLIGG